MLNHFDNARLLRAAQEAQGTEVTAVVVAIHRDNGQVFIHNIGETDGRFECYKKLADNWGTSLYELNARITFQKEGGEE